MKRVFLFLLSCIYTICFAQHKIYYVSPHGNDTNDGLSIAASWKSLAKVNSIDFQQGDRILFEGGQVFQGTLVFESGDNGTPSEPVIISSFGSGKATINANGQGTGIYAKNVGGVEFRNLIVKSNGTGNNNHNGLEFYIDQTNSDIEHVAVENIEVYGFGGRGILVWTGNTEKGFRNLSIKHCTVHNNGMGGIETLGNWWVSEGWSSLFNHKNVYVAYCKAYRNEGVPTYKDNHSGSGILISGVDSALIEYCEAYENGARNGMTTAGPVGIWLAEAKNSTIQFSESHHNRSGAGPDGGGFDIDGGAQNCIIQYCYSHDNEGGGFALFEWGSHNEFVNNVIRYNITQNDGRKNGYAGLMFWGPIVDCQVYNNTVYTDNVGATATPSAIKFIGGGMKNINVWNNIFYVGSGANMITSGTFLDNSSVSFQNNNYYSPDAFRAYWGGMTYASLDSWRNGSGQEMNGAIKLGSSEDPLFINPGGGTTINPSEGGDLTSLTAYRLQVSSNAIDAGMNLKSAGIDIGNRDFYNISLEKASAYDIGANEFDPVFFNTLPLKFLDFKADLQNGRLAWESTIANESKAKTVEMEISTDAKTFKLLKTYSIDDATAYLLTSDQIEGNFPSVFFCRLKAVDDIGRAYFSNILKIAPKSKSHSIKLFPNPAQDQITLILGIENVYSNIALRSLSGALMQKWNFSGSEEKVSLNISKLLPGVYYLEVFSKEGKKEMIPFLKN
jgi:hypothetical protein